MGSWSGRSGLMTFHSQSPTGCESHLTLLPHLFGLQLENWTVSGFFWTDCRAVGQSGHCLKRQEPAFEQQWNASPQWGKQRQWNIGLSAGSRGAVVLFGGPHDVGDFPLILDLHQVKGIDAAMREVAINGEFKRAPHHRDGPANQNRGLAGPVFRVVLFGFA